MSERQTQTEMRSVLFTDLVGSTELRVRVGEDVADELRRTHDAMLSQAVAVHSGEVIKGLGDGIMATFGSAADAVGAAVAIQQGVDLHRRRFPDQAFAVRVGVSVGDVSIEAGDVFGVAVVEASRLCAAANGEEILTAEMVRALSRGRGGFAFEPIGDLELKGLSEPLAACRVYWEPAEDVGPGSQPALTFPPLLAADNLYVGRRDLLARLDQSWADTLSGGCRMVLLAGEPGVGKTHTAAALAHRAHAAGAVVLYGRCDEDLGLPFQPFMETLDFYTQQAADPTLGRLPGELARLLPELPGRLSGLPPPVGSDPRSEEHLLFEATASWLVELAEANDVVIVLDDLHWADKPTLLLLLHVLRAGMETAGRARLLVLGTYRDTDIDRTHPLSGVLADLRRLPIVERYAIGGLTEAEVEEFVAAAAGHELDEAIRAMAEAVYAETEGNPFFVAEVLRHLVETGAVVRRDDRWTIADPGSLSVPEGVRDVIGRRLSRLSAKANEMLSLCSVMGRDVDIELLSELFGVPESDMLDALDEAVRARLIDETGADRYRFSHALVRATLYEELSATRRRRQHRRVAQALEKLRPDDVVALAYHYVEAGPEGGLMTLAVHYSLSAAELALSARALADAEKRFSQVLEVLDDVEIDESPERIRALCGLGEAQRDQGDPEFRATLLEASRLGLRAGQVALLVRSVLANQRGVISVIGSVDPERVQTAEAALEKVDTGALVDRARLLAYLAAELVFADDHKRRLALADEAEDLARSIGDRDLLAWVVVRTGFAQMALDRLDRVHARTKEGVELADESGDPALRVEARFWRTASLATMGEIEELRRLTEEMVEISRDASPSMQWMARFSTVRLLVLDGRLDEAEACNSACFAEGQAHGEPDALPWWSCVSVGIEWVRGNFAILADVMKAFADQHPQALTWRAGALAALAFDGRPEEVKAGINQYRLEPSLLLEEPFLLLIQLQLAACSYYAQDRALAEQCAKVLRPFSGKWGHWYVFITPPVDMWLAYSELALGEAGRAVSLLEGALKQVQDRRCVGFLHLVRGYLGEALLARSDPGDAERAQTELAQARREALAVGASTYAEQLAMIAELGRDPRVTLG